MSDQYAMTPEEQADSKADAFAVLALVAVVVTTAAFWLLGR